jgi:hypothetical protein
MPRPPEALPVNLTNKLAYCATCTPKLPLGFGGIMQVQSHYDPVSKTMHTLTVVAVADDEKIDAGETFQAFLQRMMTKYVP